MRCIICTQILINCVYENFYLVYVVFSTHILLSYNYFEVPTCNIISVVMFLADPWAKPEARSPDA